MGFARNFLQHIASSAPQASTDWQSFNQAGIEVDCFDVPADPDFWQGAVQCAQPGLIGEKLAAMWNGELVNTTEERRVLHWLARADDIEKSGASIGDAEALHSTSASACTPG